MENALLDSDLRAPLVPVYANVDAAPIATPGEIRVALVQQVTGMVRWRESVLAMVDAGVTEFIEFGGKVIAPMVKRIAPDAGATSVVSMADVEALAARL
jgi:[acyl-carrier-protein] S-malonyltransferase